MEEHKKNKHLVWLLVVLVIIAAVAVFGWWRMAKNNQTPKSAPVFVDSTKNPNKDNGLSINVAELAFDGPPMQNQNPDPNGPYFHSIYEATSSNGLDFTTTNVQIINHASVPDMIRLSSGQLVFYAVDATGQSRSGILMGASEDNGKTWHLGSMELSTQRNPGVAADPQITLDDSGQLRLFYTVFPGLPTPNQPPDNNAINMIYSATSTDGIHFAEDPGIRLEHAQITDPDPVKINNTWFLYVSEGPQLAYSTSTNGLDFNYQGITRSNGSVSKTIPISNGQWRQYFCLNGNISSATTVNGTAWQPDGGTRLFAPPGKVVCDPTVVQINQDNWLMIYKVAPGQ